MKLKIKDLVFEWTEDNELVIEITNRGIEMSSFIDGIDLDQFHEFIDEIKYRQNLSEIKGRHENNS